MITQPFITRRFFAGFIDYVLICTFTFVYVVQYGTQDEEGSYYVNGIAGLVPFIFWFIMTVGFEQITGATVGNGIVGLKPLDVDRKNKPNLFQSIKRHLLDPVDMFMFGFIAVIAIKNSDKHQRLGDQWAKTIVVKN